MKKIILLVVLIIIVIGVWLYLFFNSPIKDDPRKIIPEKVELSKIKIVENHPSLLMLVATKEGFFEEEGLKVELLRIVSSEDCKNILLAGEVDYTHMSGEFSEPVITASLRNAPIKTIMFTSRYLLASINTQPGLRMNNLKSIGIVSQPPLYYKLLMYKALKFIEENNLETEIIAVKNGYENLDADDIKNFLTLGMTDAVLMTPRYGIKAQTNGFPILDILMETLPASLSTRNDKIEEEPEEIQKVIRALERTMEFIIMEPEKTKEFLLVFFKIEKTEENLQMIEKTIYPLTKIIYDRRNIPADEGAELLIKLIKIGDFTTIQEVEKQVITPEEFQKVFDFRFVE